MSVERSREVPLPEAVTRTVRHEVGDLLQSLYATVALLQQRLPPDADLERRLLVDIRSRSERCRELLDATLDLVLPPALHREPVDLGTLTVSLVQDARGRYPHLKIRAECAPAHVHGDPMRLAQVGRYLLLHSCSNAREEVRVRIGPGASGEIEWEFCDDGPLLSESQLERMFIPFATPRQGLTQVGLALAGQFVQRQGGLIRARNQSGSGVQLLATLPAASEGDKGLS